ncbi:10076_t:CDS:2 [Dentiscutata erythropus]|uniref:10076_t:CDS:1 n=1 Tax=Dentiscutata erythropus TaxID=1348616 RepID=A0A9N9AYM4_9GLOM|nr:10076_t:CDS:2 [Dentiscutata erythropus]
MSIHSNQGDSSSSYSDDDSANSPLAPRININETIELLQKPSITDLQLYLHLGCVYISDNEEDLKTRYNVDCDLWTAKENTFEKLVTCFKEIKKYCSDFRGKPWVEMVQLIGDIFNKFQDIQSTYDDMINIAEKMIQVEKSNMIAFSEYKSQFCYWLNVQIKDAVTCAEKAKKPLSNELKQLFSDNDKELKEISDENSRRTIDHENEVHRRGWMNARKNIKYAGDTNKLSKGVHTAIVVVRNLERAWINFSTDLTSLEKQLNCAGKECPSFARPTHVRTAKEKWKLVGKEYRELVTVEIVDFDSMIQNM